MGSDLPQSPSYEVLRHRFQRQGQDHVFRFWDRLNDSARQQLLRQAAEIDLSALFRAADCQGSGVRTLEPLEVEQLPEFGGDPEAHTRARARGDEILRAGRVAVLVVAGGQATRLGYDAPKGLFPIGPVTRRSLFEVQAQKIRRLRSRYGRRLPWYVMTSPATHPSTRDFFKRAQHFGLPAEDVVFFEQGTVASLDFERRLILEEPGRIFENPDGHGGSLTALLACGALDDLERHGIDTIFYYQVDNPLVRMADPVFLGFHDAAGAEMSCKVVRKRDPDEKVGVLARANGRPGVVEYTEIDDEHRLARDRATGELLYWAGNTAIHVLSVPFVRRVAQQADRLLPYHASAKKIPNVDEDGRPIEPTEPNGYKFERFVFDALPAAERVCAVEALREAEYSPVKNARGQDSPETVRRDLIAQYRGWLREAGLELPPAGTGIEIDHARIDRPEDIRELGIARIAEAGDAIRTAPGAAE